MKALAWLATHAPATGRALAEGDLVLTGSVVETRWVEPGDNVRVVIGSLGEATVSIAP